MKTVTAVVKVLIIISSLIQGNLLPVPDKGVPSPPSPEPLVIHWSVCPRNSLQLFLYVFLAHHTFICYSFPPGWFTFCVHFAYSWVFWYVNSYMSKCHNTKRQYSKWLLSWRTFSYLWLVRTSESINPLPQTPSPTSPTYPVASFPFPLFGSIVYMIISLTLNSCLKPCELLAVRIS